MRKFFCFLLCCFLYCSLAAAEVHWNETPPEDWSSRDLMRLTVFRTGEGDAMLLEYGGECMLIDGAPEKYRDSLWEALQSRGIGRVRFMFSTHPHEDHIDGLYHMLRFGLQVDEFISPFPMDYSFDHHVRVVKQIKAKDIPYTQLMNGDCFYLGAVELETWRWMEGKTIDAQCPLTRVSFGDCVLLLTSDIIGSSQEYLMKILPAEWLKADVMKAPHHGLTGANKTFLDTVSPEFIFITNYSGKTATMDGQAKYRNIPYAHSGDGTIVLECDGVDWYIYQTLKQF